MTNPLTTPQSITPFVQACAKKISTNDPVYVPVVEVGKAIYGQCFVNVQKHVKEHDGKIIYGWTLWEWSGVMVDAEHHAVWEKPDGTWEDITPKPDGEQRILFVRDDAAVYDSFKSILNQRFPVATNKLAREFVALKREAEVLFEPYRQTGFFSVPDDVVERAEKKNVRAARRWNKLLADFGP